MPSGPKGRETPAEVIGKPADWYLRKVADGADSNLPGIYEWKIPGVGVYIGQYTNPRRPWRHYERNVAHLREGSPYRRNKPGKFRAIHRALADAASTGRLVILTFLENHPDKSERNRRERELIEARKREAATGGLPVLNSN
jgi:hypothetical protein